MATTQTNGSAGTEYNADAVHGKLADCIDELRACVDRADDSYYMELAQNSESHGTWSITIDSDDWLLNKGEIGDMRFHIILGPQGGLHLATHSRDLGSRKDYLDAYSTKTEAWDKLRRAIKRAK